MTLIKKQPVLIGLFALILIIGIGAVIMLTRPEIDPFDGDAVINPPFSPLSYSIQTFLWWDEGNAGTQASMVNRTLNFTYIKQTFPWRELEPRPDEWDFTQSDRIVDLANRDDIDLQIIARLGEAPNWSIDNPIIGNDDVHDTPPDDLEAWGNYCGTIAERYAGRIMAYQVWNEPNLQREWGLQELSASDYVEMLAICSEAIRAVDSEAVIISAGLSPTGLSLIHI